MHALPLALASLTAVAMAPRLLRALRQGRHLKVNYRGREVACPFGVLSVAAALAALIPLALAQKLGVAEVLHPETLRFAAYALGVAFLGLVDDTLGGDAHGGGPRGVRGHGRALLGGSLSTGVLKAAGSLGLALYVTAQNGLANGRWLLSAAVLVLATNAFNLLDLRPGRATKAFVVLAAGLTIGSASTRALWALGVFAGPALVAGIYDLRERAMLGDTGANLLGGLAGLWLVSTLSTLGQLVALALLGVMTLYGELRSLSELVERVPLLRELDSWGRPSR